MALKLILGIDSGLDSVKIVGPKGEIDFPSITILEPEMMTFGGGMGIQAKDRFELGIEGEKWLLGSHAKLLERFNPDGFDSRGTSGAKNDERAYIRAFGGICKYIDAYEKFEEDIDVYFAYTSPLEDSGQNEVVAEITDTFLNEGRPHEIEFNGHHLNIRVKDIIVLPEGAVAYFSTVFTTEEVYLVDAGSHTINLAAFIGETALPLASKTVPNGVEYFKKMYKEDRAPKMTAKKIKSSAEQLKWPKGAKLHVCGGFSNQIFDAFNHLQPNKYTMEIIRPELIIGRKTKVLDPIFANAAGAYFIAKDAFSTTSTVKG